MPNRIHLLATASSLAAVALWFVAPSGASLPKPVASLEGAANPFGGTRAQWDALSAGGGVQKHDRWHGLPVSKAKLRFDSTGRVVEIAMSTEQSAATVREIREPINEICGFREKDWDMSTNDNFLSGTAENTRCRAEYLPEDNKYWTYTVRRQARLDK